MRNIINFITSRSEHTRKVIAGTGVAIAGVLLFFAWTAGVSARLPLLGSEFDPSAIARGEPSNSEQSIPSTGAESGEQSRATTVSPMKGLIESFQDLAKLFRGEYPAAASNISSSSTPAAPIDGLFNKISDETQATTTSDATTTRENLPPIEDLPGL